MTLLRDGECDGGATNERSKNLVTGCKNMAAQRHAPNFRGIVTPVPLTFRSDATSPAAGAGSA